MTLVQCVDSLDILVKVYVSYFTSSVAATLIGATTAWSSYTEHLKTFHITDLHCSGTENNILNCSHNTIQQYRCYSAYDAYVQCPGVPINFKAVDMNIIILVPTIVQSNCTKGDVRLARGLSQYEGIVEICYGSSWLSICPRSWGSADAQVVCRQLGYTPIGQ